MRGWNVAIPEVDRGDDIFVVKDDDGDMKRVQVKTANANRTLRGYSTQFNVPKKTTQHTIHSRFNLLFCCTHRK